MKQTIDKLTQLNAELEGLLLVLAKRDNENIRTLIRSRYESYKQTFEDLLSQMQNPELNAESRMAVETKGTASSSTQDEERKENAECKLQEATETEVIPEDIAATRAIEAGMEVGKQRDASSSIQKEESRFMPPKHEVPLGPSLFDDTEIVPVTLGEIESTADEDTAPFIAPTMHNQRLNTAVNEEKTETTNDSIKPQPSVSDMIARREAADLKRVFTLNDKMHFRRTLFNHNDAQFTEALDQLARLESFDGAKKFVKETYGWDLADNEVADFLSIIKPHYPA